MQRAVKLVKEIPDHGLSQYYLYMMAFQFWQQNHVQPDSEIMKMLEGRLTQPENIRSCDDAYAATKLSMIRDDRGLALESVNYLLDKGYFEPGFVQFCRKYELCAR